MGRVKGKHLLPHVDWMSETQRSKSALSRSMRLMKKARGNPSSSVKRQANSVPTCRLDTASIVIMAVSTARRAHFTSPMKSM